MKEDKEKQKNNTTISSKVQDKKGQSSEELLEEILNKKKLKKTKKTKDTKAKETTETDSDKSLKKSEQQKSSSKEKSSKTKESTKKVPKNAKSKKAKTELSADELLDNIIAKKAKKTSRKKTSSSEKSLEKPEEEKVSIEINQTKEPIETNNLATTPKKTDEKKSENPSISEEDKKSPAKKNLDDLIITRKITFDDQNLNLKNKKTLQELRKAIEEFDRLETLSEIANSSDKINDAKKENIFENEENTTKEEQENRDLFKTSMIVLDSRFDRLYKSDNENELEETNIDSNEKNSNKEDVFDSDEMDEQEYINDFGNFAPEEVRPHRIKKKSYFDKEEFNLIILITFIIILLALFILILFLYLGNSGESNSINLEPEVKNIISDDNSDKQEYEYQQCLQSEVPEMEILPSELEDEIVHLHYYLEKNYKTSILYKDLTTGFTYGYNQDVVYYAASTIKALDGLYIYSKAATGELDLEEKIEYKSKYKAQSSKGMSQYKYGEKVSLRNLVKYAIVYSDNSALHMLIDYIGKNNLKEFGKSLGATVTLMGSDDFGSINVEDAIIYMKSINDFINNNPELGEELKTYLITAEQNDLELKDLNIEAAHKYGNYGNYYHDYGIVYDEHPYLVAILTTEGKGDYEEKVKDINRHIYELHKAFYSTREKQCKLEIYGS